MRFGLLAVAPLVLSCAIVTTGQELPRAAIPVDVARETTEVSRHRRDPA
jgi:hypothetical protein